MEERDIVFDNDMEENEEDHQANEMDFSDAVVWGTDWTTETIARQIAKGNIDLNPNFQRRDAWSGGEKSKLIESLMLNIPVPPIVLPRRGAASTPPPPPWPCCPRRRTLKWRSSRRTSEIGRAHV